MVEDVTGENLVSCSELKYFGDVSVRVRSDQPHAYEMMILQEI